MLLAEADLLGLGPGRDDVDRIVDYHPGKKNGDN